MALFGSKTVLGVDLGTAGIKIVELSRSDSRFDLKNYGILDFIARKESAPKLDDQVLAAGLKELLARVKADTQNIVASIPSFSTFATVIELPYLSEKDLERAIPFEARKYIPIPLQEVVIDWTIINIAEISRIRKNTPASSEYPNVEVFLVAVPKEEIERYKTIFRRAGLGLKAAEIENIALIRSLIGEDPSPLTIVNLGGRSTSIVVVEKGFERVSRNYELGGFEITKALANALNVSFDRAEQLKKTEGLKGITSGLAEAMIPLIDLIVFEVKKTVANYEENRKVKVGKVVLTGGQANMPGLKEYFGQKLLKETVVGNPFAKVSFSKALGPILGGLGTSLAVAVGLAMRRI